MSKAEVTLYIALSSILFILGAVLLIRCLIREGKSKRLAGWTKLTIWFLVPLVLGFFAMAAMMNPLGGGPVISTLRKIFVIYIIGSSVLIMMRYRKKVK